MSSLFWGHSLFDHPSDLSSMPVPRYGNVHFTYRSVHEVEGHSFCVIGQSLASAGLLPSYVCVCLRMPANLLCQQICSASGVFGRVRLSKYFTLCAPSFSRRKFGFRLQLPILLYVVLRHFYTTKPLHHKNCPGKTSYLLVRWRQPSATASITASLRSGHF
jgi:hypothetical protein